MTAEQAEEILRTMADDGESFFEHASQPEQAQGTVCLADEPDTTEGMQGSTTFPLRAVVEALRDGAAAIRALRLVSDRPHST